VAQRDPPRGERLVEVGPVEEGALHREVGGQVDNFARKTSPAMGTRRQPKGFWELGTTLTKARHGLDEVASTFDRARRHVPPCELAAPSLAEVSVPFFEEERASLLVVRASRGSDAKQARRERVGAQAWSDMTLELVDHRALDVLDAEHPVPSDDDEAFPRRGQRGDPIGRREPNAKSSRTDLGGETRHEAPWVALVVAPHELGRRSVRCSGLVEPPRGDLVGGIGKVRRDATALAREAKEVGRPDPCRHPVFEREFCGPVAVERGEWMLFPREEFREPKQLTFELARRRRLVMEAGLSRSPRTKVGLEGRELAREVERCGARDHADAPLGLCQARGDAPIPIG
jgi:hypothetical protein